MEPPLMRCFELEGRFETEGETRSRPSFQRILGGLSVSVDMHYNV